MARRRWTVEDLGAMTFPKQGDLFAWTAACDEARQRQLRAWLDAVMRGEPRAGDCPRPWNRDALAAAARASVYAGIPAWETLRWLVYERDGGICRVCGQPIEPEYYECGHLVDRVAGGRDIPENLVAMHNVCNRLKPVHDTREDALAWCDSRPKEPGWWLRPLFTSAEAGALAGGATLPEAAD